MLTVDQHATNNETFRHIERVRNLLNLCVIELLNRGALHDQSKLESPEVEVFAEFTPKLAAHGYATAEYFACLAEMKPALDHHYAKNSHHPQHYADGVTGMNLFDIIEMLCDWKAASERQSLDFQASLQKSIMRFQIEPQLAAILNNTATVLFPSGDEKPT